MNFYWLYDTPNWLFASITMGVFVAFSVAGLALTRAWVARAFGRHHDNDIVSYYLATVGVFYGITLGLIAVGTYQNYSDVESKVAEEAASVGGIYRDVSSYPEPARSQLRGLMEEYTRYVIEEAWPQQHKGIIPSGGTERTTSFQAVLMRFNATTESEKALHVETLREFNHMVEVRRLRLQSVIGGLPSIMYMVIVLGALVNIMVSWLFVVDNYKLHAFLNALMAALLGLLVFLIAAMDNPFRGGFSVGPDPFVVVRTQLMTPGK
jgi:hypothetical protein